ncbi:hypothetical protein [Rhodopseudomonas palustris]|uniref:hypothetical protein n=1 Tax=Rhodopseudomonas palustris TaxID=1076 RepID=UPI000E5B3632|nr:hypothetical protein [Rhodopseudomonas palustris]QLH72120.1 hypothetical protein HZF03_15515 [Rhodopseudomonas palustris]RIA02214.1 hypothetical protein D1920_08560 [Rhodopseudomonas palustris]
MTPRRHDNDHERRKWRQVAGHFGMGAAFGALFAGIVLFNNYFGLSSVIATSEAPILVRIIFVVGVAGSFAFMAAITGFLFLVHED